MISSNWIEHGKLWICGQAWPGIAMVCRAAKMRGTNVTFQEEVEQAFDFAEIRHFQLQRKHLLVYIVPELKLNYPK